MKEMMMISRVPVEGHGKNEEMTTGEVVEDVRNNSRQPILHHNDLERFEVVLASSKNEGRHIYQDSLDME